MIHEGKKTRMYDEGDEDAPFMTEAFLYTALGKEDARTLLALVGTVIAACGLDRVGIYKAVNERLAALKAERELREVQRRRQALLRECRRAGAEGYGVAEDEWPLLEHLAKYPDRWKISEPYARAGRQWKKFTEIPRND
jgi:hypothetical protein